MPASDDLQAKRVFPVSDSSLDKRRNRPCGFKFPVTRLIGQVDPHQPLERSLGKRGHVHRDPGREALPSSSATEGIADLLRENQDSCRPDGYALHLASGPPVVADH